MLTLFEVLVSVADARPKYVIMYIRGYPVYVRGWLLTDVREEVEGHSAISHGKRRQRRAAE